MAPDQPIHPQEPWKAWMAHPDRHDLAGSMLPASSVGASLQAIWRSHPGVLSGLLLLLCADALLPLFYGFHALVRITDFLGVFFLAFWVACLAWRRALRDGPLAFGLLGLGAALGGRRYAPTLLRLPHAMLLGPAISILSMLSMGGGFLLWPQRMRLPRDRVRTSLDGVAIAISLFALAWMAIGSTPWVGRLPRGMVLLYMIQISACLGLLTLWLLQETSLDLPEQAQAKRFVRWALVVLLVYNSLVILLRITGFYRQNYLGDAAEVLHQAVNVLLALAALSPSAPSTDPPERERPSVFRALLPTLVSLAVLLLIAFQVLRPQALPPRTLLALGFGLMAVLGLRHGLLILDLERLSQGLEARVEARTQELEVHHRDAMNGLRIRMMAGLAAGLAHDLNNLLGIIRMRLEILGEACDPGQLDTVQILRETTERAIAMTRRILASGRFQALAPEAFSLEEWFAAHRGLLSTLLHPGQRLILQSQGDPGVFVDPQSLDQILQNLVSNARDAMGPDGTLRIQAEGLPDLVRITVQDDGSGLPPDQLEHLFEPFFTTKPSGTGLGLATVRNLVAQNRGTIRVDSAPGQGTAFTLELPTRPRTP
jgi:signal transduction histidine kinase